MTGLDGFFSSGFSSITRCRFVKLPAKSPISVSIVVSGDCLRTARIVSTHISAPPSFKSSLSTHVITQCFTRISFTLLATRNGSIGSTASGLPVATAQNPQERVQIFPSIINVAVPAPQHSPMLGQLPLSQMDSGYRRSARFNDPSVPENVER